MVDNTERIILLRDLKKVIRRRIWLISTIVIICSIMVTIDAKLKFLDFSRLLKSLWISVIVSFVAAIGLSLLLQHLENNITVDETDVADRSNEKHRNIQTQTTPPKLATLLLCLFLTKTDRDNIIGDMDEQFPKCIERHGLRVAQFLYFKDACTTIYPAVLKLIAKIVSITGLGEIIRRFHIW